MERILSDKLLIEALCLYEEKLLDSVPMRHIIPSKKFEKRMYNMIKSRTSVCHRLTFTRARKTLAIAAAAAILLASALSVGAIRDAVLNFFVSHSEDLNYLEYNVEAETFPETIAQVYAPAYVPDGYKLTEHKNDSDTAIHLYTKGDNYISVEQFTKNVYHSASDNGFSDVKIVRRGSTDYIVRKDSDSAVLLVWERYGYVFECVSFLSEPEALKTAQSIKAE